MHILHAGYADRVKGSLWHVLTAPPSVLTECNLQFAKINALNIKLSGLFHKLVKVSLWFCEKFGHLWINSIHWMDRNWLFIAMNMNSLNEIMRSKSLLKNIKTNFVLKLQFPKILYKSSEFDLNPENLNISGFREFNPFPFSLNIWLENWMIASRHWGCSADFSNVLDLKY